MRRFALLALPLALLLPALVATAEGETRTFSEHNFKLTTPSEAWEWQELSMQAQQAGFVAELTRHEPPVFVRASVRVAPAGDPPLPVADLNDEVEQGLRQQMEEVGRSGVRRGMLSGLQASEVYVEGQMQGMPAMFRCFTIQHGGRFHQLILLLVNGAETRLAREVDALRRGYRLLQGAGPEEPAPPEGAVHGGIEEDEGEAPADWPPNGPRVDGRTLVFPHHNLRWTLPEDSPFGWRRPIEDESAEEGVLVMAVARFPREGAEEEEPQENAARVLLFVEPSPEGFDPKRLVTSQQVQSQLAENLFDNVSYGRTKAIEDLEIGNYRGAALQLVGAREGMVQYFRLYAVNLRGKRYQWEAVMLGGREVDDVFKAHLTELMKGIEFPETVQPVRGPCAIPGIGAFGMPRGYGHGEEKEITSVGFTAEKPEEMYEINYDPQAVPPNQRLAWETRSEDGKAYLYFDVQTFSLRDLREQGDYAEDMIRQRKDQWEQIASGVQTIARGREIWYKDRFDRGRGLGYEFRGTLHDEPFVEEGWIVEYKRYVYWIRLQHGGEGAERLFSKLARKLQKSVKFRN